MMRDLANFPDFRERIEKNAGRIELKSGNAAI